jgi:5-methyltetrahydropteroyltriglutamate--homocysteine methyltransferase
MKRSTDRILTTHVGSLVRTREIIEAMKARTLNQPYDRDQFEQDLRAGVTEVVRKQVEVGIDVPSDGEYSRHGFVSYINDRMGGLEPRPLDPDEDIWRAYLNREQQAFPEFFAQYNSHFRYLWMLPQVSMDEVANVPGNYERFRVTGPVSYTGQAELKRDLDNFTAALEGQPVEEAFFTAVTPMSRKLDRDVLKHYPSDEAYMYALADALREEYTAIVEAGFVLQLDYALLNPRNHALFQEKPDATEAEITRLMEVGIEVVNHALQDIPEDRVRYHHCWGSMNTPHTFDTPLREIVALLFKIKAQAYAIEAANPRHEHEWMVWKDVKLPDGKILIPGLISHATNVVEHPELIAWRIQNFASVVGKENLIAGADCGFSQYWDSIRVHPTVQWAKLQALAEGAALASQTLWGRKSAAQAKVGT